METLSQKDGFCRTYTYWDDHVVLFSHSPILTMIKLQMKLVLYPRADPNCSSCTIFWVCSQIWFIKEFLSVNIIDIGLNFAFVNVRSTSSNYFKCILGFLFFCLFEAGWHILQMVEFSHAAVWSALFSLRRSLISVQFPCLLFICFYLVLIHSWSVACF